MGRYNLLFGIDTVFEFFHTVLGIIFSDMSALSDMEVIRRYCGGFSIVRSVRRKRKVALFV